MRIYIDFDDVLCETALAFTRIAKEMFGINVPYREVQFFNLKKTFDLTDSQYEELMKAGHFPDNLLNYEETPGASETINKWVDMGHEVFIITGRPFNSYEPSRHWLDEHKLERVPLYCVDKYGRENWRIRRLLFGMFRTLKAAGLQYLTGHGIYVKNFLMTDL